MKFQIGDKVRLNKKGIEKVCQEALNDIKKLDSNGVFTINEIIQYKGAETQCRAKEFRNIKWRWYESHLESTVKPVPINNRFEILDL